MTEGYRPASYDSENPRPHTHSITLKMILTKLTAGLLNL